MRTIISHFFNEEYLLPWWLEHHLPMFDHGVLIDHGSNDASLDICRQLAPHWRVVRSRLTHFDAYLTDFEVMGYEQELPGWKIALNTTEFLLPAAPLESLERALTQSGRGGCSATGMIVVDPDPRHEPVAERPLLLQKHHAVDDNTLLDPAQRAALGIGPVPMRNRFYHRQPVGMYHPGRHRSFHPDAQVRFTDLFVLHFAFAPWTEKTVARKLQIASKLLPEDVKRGWGQQHTKTRAQLDAQHEALCALAIDLRLHPGAGAALLRLPALDPQQH